MRIRDLIDFHLAIRTPDSLLGFDSLYADDLERLKWKIQDYYGSRDAWLNRDEDEALPEEIEAPAAELMKRYEEWKGGGEADVGL